MNTIWRATLSAGSPAPSSYWPKAVFEGPDGESYVLATAHVCATNDRADTCSSGPQPEVRLTRLETSGAVAWTRPLGCAKFNCSSGILYSAASSADGILLLRPAVLNTGSPRQGVGIIQKLNWHGEIMLETAEPPAHARPSLIQTVGSQFVFADFDAQGKAFLRTLDPNGRPVATVPIDVTCKGGALFPGAESRQIFWCPLRASSPGRPGAQLFEFDAAFRLLRQQTVPILSSASLVVEAADGWVVIRAGRGDTSDKPSALLLSFTGRVSSSTHFRRFQGRLEVHAAASTRAPNEFMAVYSAQQNSSEIAAVIARIVVEP